MRYGCGLGIAYLVIFIVVDLVAESILGQGGAICVRIASIIVGFTIMPRILKDIRYKQRLEAPSATEVLAKDKRPPIIYLRSFKEEGSRQEASPIFSIYPLINPLGAAAAELPTFEQDLARYVETIGPFVTFSNKKYGPPELGAARLNAERGTWREILDDLLKRCQFIVFRAGETESLLWELGKIVDEVPAEKVLIYLQMGIEKDAAVQQARYNKFRRLTQSILPKPLPEKRGKNEFLHFTSDWTPILSRNIKTALREKKILFEGNLVRHGLKNLLPFARVDIEVYKQSWPPLQISKRLGIRPGGKKNENAAQPMQGQRKVAEEANSFLNQEHGDKIFYSPYLTKLGTILAFGCLVSLIFGGLYWYLDRITVDILFVLSFIFLAVFASIVGALIGFLGRYLVFPGSWAYLFAGLLAGSVFMFSRLMFWASHYYQAFTTDPVMIFTAMSDVADFVDRSGADSFYLWALWIIEVLEAVSLITLTAWVYGLSRSEYQQATGHSILAPGDSSQTSSKLSETHI